jgi:hypothetical protein
MQGGQTRHVIARLLLFISPRLPVKCGRFTYYVPVLTLLRLGGAEGFRRSVSANKDQLLSA